MSTGSSNVNRNMMKSKVLANLSPLSEVAFNKLFDGHALGDVERDVFLTVLDRVSKNSDFVYEPIDVRSDANFKLHLMVGLPRSGKSTMVKDLGYVVINPDSVRLAFHGKRFDADKEPMVWMLVQEMVKELYNRGAGDVIIDATNVSASRRDMWLSQYRGELVVVRTSVAECIDRAIATGQEDLIPVIESMAAAWDVDGTYSV